MDKYDAVLNPAYCIDVTSLIERLPDFIKGNVIDFDSVSIMVKGKRKRALRVLLDKVLTEEEKESVRCNKHILNIDGIARYRYAPEIKHTYFYLV